MKGKHEETASTAGSTLARSSDLSQLDFELDFFGRILGSHPDYIDVLRVQGNNLTLKGRYAEGLHIDKRLVQLRPSDPLAHYNLACSFCLVKKSDLALKTLRRGFGTGLPRFPLSEGRPRPGCHSPRPAFSAIVARIRKPLNHDASLRGHWPLI